MGVDLREMIMGKRRRRNDTILAGLGEDKEEGHSGKGGGKGKEKGKRVDGRERRKGFESRDGKCWWPGCQSDRRSVGKNRLPLGTRSRNEPFFLILLPFFHFSTASADLLIDILSR